MSVLHLFLLGLIVVFSSTSFSNSKKVDEKKVAPQFRLLYAEDLQKLPLDARADYIFALREFMTSSQEKNPKFAEYLFNFLAGDLPEASANALKTLSAQEQYTKCVSQISDIGLLKSNCVETFHKMISDGVMKCGDAKADPNSPQITSNCDFNGRKMQVIMSTKGSLLPDRYTEATLSAKIHDATTKRDSDLKAGADGAQPWQPKPSSPAPTAPASQPNPPPSAKPFVPTTNCKVNPGTAYPYPGHPNAGGVGGVTCTPAGQAIDASTKPTEKKDPTRCIYAGFLIKTADGSDDNSCAPVTNICSYARKTIPDVSTINAEICKNPANGSCEGSGASGSIASKASGKPKVVCNPLLYGLDDSKHVLCVDRGSDASAKCNDSATKDPKKISDFIDCKPGKPCPFNDMVAALQKRCLYMTKKVGSEYQDNESMNRAQFEQDKADGKWVNADDFKKTCQVLLKRAADIGKEVSDSAAAPQPTTVVPATPTAR